MVRTLPINDITLLHEMGLFGIHDVPEEDPFADMVDAIWLNPHPEVLEWAKKMLPMHDTVCLNTTDVAVALALPYVTSATDTAWFHLCSNPHEQAVAFVLSQPVVSTLWYDALIDNPNPRVSEFLIEHVVNRPEDTASWTRWMAACCDRSDDVMVKALLAQPHRIVASAFLVNPNAWAQRWVYDQWLRQRLPNQKEKRSQLLDAFALSSNHGLLQVVFRNLRLGQKIRRRALSENECDAAVDFLIAHPEWIVWPSFAMNPNPKVVAFILNLPEAAMKKQIARTEMLGNVYQETLFDLFCGNPHLKARQYVEVHRCPSAPAWFQRTSESPETAWLQRLLHHSEDDHDWVAPPLEGYVEWVETVDEAKKDMVSMM